MDLTTAFVIVFCALTAPLWMPFVIGGVVLVLGIPVILICAVCEVFAGMFTGREKEANRE